MGRRERWVGGRDGWEGEMGEGEMGERERWVGGRDGWEGEMGERERMGMRKAVRGGKGKGVKGGDGRGRDRIEKKRGGCIGKWEKLGGRR